jgi:hypothetical protein
MDPHKELEEARKELGCRNYMAWEEEQDHRRAQMELEEVRHMAWEEEPVVGPRKAHIVLVLP